MYLNDAQKADLRSAILAAYPGVAGLNKAIIALADAGIDASRYATLFSDMEGILFSLIEQENERGQVASVLGAVRRAAPENKRLSALEVTLLKTVSAEEVPQLEAMVMAQLNYAPANAWLTELAKAFHWVGRIEGAESGASLGTGFLVGDDLLFTNYHVLYGTAPPGLSEPARIRARFDLIGGSAGRPADLADDWLLVESPPGGREWGGAGDPSSEQLDFVLLRLREPVGRDRILNQLRGHAPLASSTSAASQFSPLIVLQHPAGANLQVCLGAFDRPNESRTRLFHTATTQHGSSGSPCLSMDLKVVGLHNGGFAGRNSAIPLQLILSNVKQRIPGLIEC
ncbi:serine protease [Bradyrhizobium sp. CW1]|uniref:trypsin-like serine peptidase n=1 Tax=unclassified Bradyrhizobium TaxID=2631580 RepID=UPI001FFFCFAE|nr:serine protease [Bradyrhizobium sp. CW1]UPJ27803.1 trypsin-like peptidase domain-containing protein [Bradyrhizobium sp. CW1]